MTLEQIIQNRPHLNDVLFQGFISVKDRNNYVQQKEEFKSRIERKELSDMLTNQYHEKLLFSGWTINITIL